MVKNRASDLPQEEIEKQWEVVGLYCVFIFKKVGNGGGDPQAAATSNADMRASSQTRGGERESSFRGGRGGGRGGRGGFSDRRR